jgi:hypothetical protein
MWIILNKNGQSLETHFLLIVVLMVVATIFAISPIAVDMLNTIFAKNEKVYQETQNKSNNSNSIETNDYEVTFENNNIIVNGELDEDESIIIVTSTLSNYNIEFLRENKKIECYNCYIEMQGKYYYVKTNEQEYWVKPDEIIKLEKTQ